MTKKSLIIVGAVSLIIVQLFVSVSCFPLYNILFDHDTISCKLKKLYPGISQSEIAYIYCPEPVRIYITSILLRGSGDRIENPGLLLEVPPGSYNILANFRDSFDNQNERADNLLLDLEVKAGDFYMLVPKRDLFHVKIEVLIDHFSKGINKDKEPVMMQNVFKEKYWLQWVEKK